MKKSLKIGHAVPRSGLYDVIGPRGGNTGKQITSVKGEHFPPHGKGKVTYKLSDPAKHKRL